MQMPEADLSAEHDGICGDSEDGTGLLSGGLELLASEAARSDAGLSGDHNLPVNEELLAQMQQVGVTETMLEDGGMAASASSRAEDGEVARPTQAEWAQQIQQYLPKPSSEIGGALLYMQRRLACKRDIAHEP